MKQYFQFILIALDQLFNTILGGYPDETLSASAYIGEKQGRILPKFFRPVIDGCAAFFFNDTEHCKNAADSESLGLQLPDTYLRKKTNGPSRE